MKIQLNILKCLGIIPLFLVQNILLAEELTENNLSLKSVISRTLENSPDIYVQKKQLQSRKGNIKTARGGFDAVMSASLTGSKQQIPRTNAEITALNNANIPNEKHSSNNVSYGVGLSKKLDLGVTVGAGLSVSNTQDKFKKRLGIENQQTGTAELFVSIPLNRSFNYNIVGVDVLVAQKNYEEAYSTLIHTTSQTVLNNIVLFWDYLAKTKQLKISENSERRMTRVYKNIKTLVIAKEIPRSELGLVLASLTEKRSGLLSAEFDLVNARKTLGRSMGLSAKNSFALASPQNLTFPEILPETVKKYTAMNQQLMEDTINQALAQRQDLKAFGLQQDAINYQLKNFRNEQKSNINLELSLGYAGLSEGSALLQSEELFDKTLEGPSISASISYQKPYGSSVAKGQWITQKASLDSLNVLIKDLEYDIAANIQIETKNLLTSVAQLEQENISIGSYKRSLKNEHVKRNLGLSTWLDIINISDRLERAQLLKIRLQQKIVISLAKLTFERGLLIEKDARDKDSFKVKYDALDY
ncbi:MAG: TolC family protein [Methylococcales bacterium]|jgi:outer membrane protein|nr:TolC family protein [Methylococcales bacterium]MBT7408753.1 TolC family protein [Methylococcales bacterium]